MGAAVNALPGAEIVPAMDRGLLDAAEFNNASSDRALGFPDVSKICMLQSYPPERRAVRDPVQQDQVRRAAGEDEGDHRDTPWRRRPQDMSWKAIDRYSKDYIELQTKDKVRFYRTPDSGAAEAARGVRPGRGEEVGRESHVSKRSPTRSAFAARAVKWDLDTNVSRRMAYNHYFSKMAAKPVAPAAKKS